MVQPLNLEVLVLDMLVGPVHTGEVCPSEVDLGAIGKGRACVLSEGPLLKGEFNARNALIGAEGGIYRTLSLRPWAFLAESHHRRRVVARR